MRHKHGYNKLGRKSGHRRALLRNMVTSLVIHERIETTLPKARELKSVFDKMVTLGKRGDLHARRLAASYIFDDEAVRKLFSSLAPRFKDRPGGYTRIVKQGDRRGDCAQMAIIEVVDYVFAKDEKVSSGKSSKATLEAKA